MKWYYQRRGRRDVGYTMPWYLGFLWHDWARREQVVCLMPFNLIGRFGRALWVWMMHPIHGLDPIFNEAKLFKDLFHKEQLRAIKAEDKLGELIEKFGSTVDATVSKKMAFLLDQAHKQVEARK